MVTIYPSALNGEIGAIASKSDAHRCLICAALADAPTTIEMSSVSEDIIATINCIRALGAEVEQTASPRLQQDTEADHVVEAHEQPTTADSSQLATADSKPSLSASAAVAIPLKNVVKPVPATAPAHAEPGCRPMLDCKESGTTLRLLLPVVTAMYDLAAFTGSGRLPERPLSPLLEEMEKHGCRFSAEQIPLTVEGWLNGGVFTLPGDVSSQFVSGLLLALPLTKEGGSIQLTTALESSGYVDMTIYAMRKFGVYTEVLPDDSLLKTEPVQKNKPVLPNELRISAGQQYKSPGHIKIEGDFSNAAFWLTAGALSGTITCTSLNPYSKQPDRLIVDILSKMGADIRWNSEEISDRVISKNRNSCSNIDSANMSICKNDNAFESSITVHCSKLHATEIDASGIPDLVPILAVAASVAKGTTFIRSAGRLRLKESDRLHAIADNLLRIGGKVSEFEDGLEITGVNRLEGGEIDSYNDHRIAMAFAVASTVSREPVIIHGADAVSKSYPEFFNHFRKLGGAMSYVQS